MNHLAFIMDGNRRYAQAQNLPKTSGHQHGLDKLFEVLRWIKDTDIKEVSVYAFSSENWNRSKIEVDTLLSLIQSTISERESEFHTNNVRVRFIGDLARFSASLQKKLHDLEDKTRSNTRILNVALSYGGRAELLAATQSILDNKEKNGSEEPLTEESFEQHLWSKDMSDPDLVIRTGGNQRLSNFFLWRCAYSELFFTDTLWPAYTRCEFDQHLADFRKIKQNYGV